MKVKPTNPRRQECLRIKVLRKTVSLKNFKRKPIVIELTTEEGHQQLEKFLEKTRQVNEALRKKVVPKTPVKKNQENENRMTLNLFNFNTITANFSRKFGIERKIITPTKKNEPSSNGMKSGKGAKYIYM